LGQTQKAEEATKEVLGLPLVNLLFSRNLERSAGSLAQLVQLILQRVDLPFDVAEGSALRRDEHDESPSVYTEDKNVLAG
jgi:hypothetical protein